MPYNSLNGYALFDLPTNGSLPPSLYPQPAATSVRVYSPPVRSSAPGLPSITTTTSTTSGPKSPIFSDLFSDDLQSSPTTTISPQDAFPSRKLSGSPDLVLTPDLPGDPSTMAKQDHLVTQAWKMYARTKVTQPHAHRMENVTWRMMALALQKKKREEERNAVDGSSPPTKELVPDTPVVKQESPSVPPRDLGETERGRRIDKGKGTKISVVGFDADGFDDSEYVSHVYSAPFSSYSSILPLGMWNQWTGGNLVDLNPFRLTRCLAIQPLEVQSLSRNPLTTLTTCLSQELGLSRPCLLSIAPQFTPLHSLPSDYTASPTYPRSLPPHPLSTCERGVSTIRP